MNFVFCSFIAFGLSFLVFYCLSPFICNLFFLKKSSIPKLQNSKPQVLKLLVVFVCRRCEFVSKRDFTSHPLLLIIATIHDYYRC